jgi:predicted RNA methylase
MRKKKTENYLSRHSRYIDYRINRILNHIPCGKEESRGSAEAIILYLTSSTDEQDPLGNFFPGMEELREIRALLTDWSILEDGDLLGYIYQALQSRDCLKNKGQFFTPGDIVRHLVRSVLEIKGINPDMRILDPACGSGQFLMALFSELMEFYVSSGYDRKEAAEVIVTGNIFGLDADPVVVHIARYNLARISGLDMARTNIFSFDFLDRDMPGETPGPVPGLTARPFDIIIGNPPWGSRLSPERKAYFKSRYESPGSGINTFSLFIERAYDFLRDQGHLAYLVPEAYLNIRAHRTSRRLMLERTVIHELAVWGERFKNVFAPSISLIARSEKREEVRQASVIRIFNGKEADRRLATVIPQSAFLRTTDNIFNINYSRKCVNLINTIEEQRALCLKDRAQFYLGIVTGNNERFIHDERAEDQPDPIITGSDVSQYQINFSNHYFAYNQQELQQVAPRHLYLSQEKIVYKFIGRNLTFALDRKGYYSLNNVNGFIPDPQYLETINIETLLSILNSDMMQYYYEKNFFTLKVLRGNLEKLPIRRISSESQRRLKICTVFLMNEAEPASDYALRQRENIEDIIFYEYGIKERDAFRIWH